jgi:hypothetical protein
MDSAMQLWLKVFDDRIEFANTPIVKLPTMSQTDKRHHWGCGLEDGSRVSVDTSPKSPEKVILVISHTKLEGPEALERWPTYWKTLLESL